MKLRRRQKERLPTNSVHTNYHTINHENIVKKYKTSDSMVTISNPQKKMKSEGSRLRKMTQKTQKESLNQNSQKTLQLTNANSFRHFLEVSYINQNYLKWAFGLRQHQPTKLKRSISQIPGAYYKTIQAYKTHHQVNQIPAKINFSQVQHLATHGQHPSTGTLRFQTTLRDTEDVTQELQKRQKKFNIIPIKERNEYPKLLASKSLKKKQITSVDTQTAFDGAQNYPKFTDKIIRERNYNNIRQMMKGKVNLPSIGWQTGLRFYS